MAYEYCELAHDRVKGACSVTYISTQDLKWDISCGKSVEAAWPADVSLRMNPERPKDVALVDYVSNLEGLLLASPRLQAFFRTQSIPDLEMLKVTILDHKGRVAADDYAVVHCTRVRDCVDQDKSTFKWDGLDDPSMSMEELVLAQNALGPDDRMIRPRFVPGHTLYRMDLVDALKAQRFTGVGFSREIFGDYDYD